MRSIALHAIAMAALCAGGSIAIDTRPTDERLPDRNPRPAPPPPPPPKEPDVLTRQQRRAAEREALKDPVRYRPRNDIGSRRYRSNGR